MKNAKTGLTFDEAATYLKVRVSALTIYLQGHSEIVENGYIDLNHLNKEIEKESLKRK